MFGNPYLNKNYKLFPLIPIALLLISIYFIPHLTLDSTLRGGVQVQIQTNTTIPVSTLTSEINSKISGSQASVSMAPGGVSVTIVTNASLATAQQALLGVYSADSNYSTAAAQIAGYQNELRNKTANATAQAALTAWQANATAALQSESSRTAFLLTTLAPLLNGKTYNYSTSDAQSMVTAAQDAYNNASTNYQNSVVSTLKSVIPFTVYSYQSITPTLGSYFLGQMQTIIIASFIIVALAVFFLFRTPIPSFAVVFGAANDILIALGLMAVFGIPLGVASIGGLLMLIGYSIDTDMLAAIRIIKRGEGTPADRAFSTFKTGVTMTFAAILTFSVLLVVSYFAFIPTYFEIASVVLFGLIGDLFATWLGNTPMVLWYKQRKEVKS